VHALASHDPRGIRPHAGDPLAQLHLFGSFKTGCYANVVSLQQRHCVEIKLQSISSDVALMLPIMRKYSVDIANFSVQAKSDPHVGVIAD
jgi:hypothetical protein